MITNANLETVFFSTSPFVMERQINSPRFSILFAFVVIMLGTHKPQQQATTAKIKIPKMIIRFRFCNPTQRKSRIRDFYLFAPACFCEDGNEWVWTFFATSFRYRKGNFYGSDQDLFNPKDPTVLKILRHAVRAEITLDTK